MPPDALAAVEGRIISAEDFQHLLARRAHGISGTNAEAKEKQALLEEMIRFEVVYQKALAAGYDKTPQIAADLKRLIVAKFQEDQFRKLAPSKVSAEEVDEYYRQNPQRFGTPAKARIALIEFKVARTATAERRAEFARKAAAVLAEASTNAPADGTFGLLAQNHSEDQSSRYRGGDIGWVTAGDTNAPWAPPVLEAIFKLQHPGDLGPVIETPTAFYLVKLVESRPASLRPLAEVKDGIEYLLVRQKEQQQAQTLYDGFKQGLKIQTNPALLESIHAPAIAHRPPALPGSVNAETRAP